MIPRISRNAVKEGFDTLPAAICYLTAMVCCV